MNPLFSRLALALAISTLVACGGNAAGRAAAPSLDDAAWRPCEKTEIRFEPRLASASPVAHDEAPPVAMRPNPRQNLHGSLNGAHE